MDSTWILRRYVEDQISTNFHVISAYFFDVILIVEKSTWFPRTFFDVISLVEKFTWFSHTLFDVISMVEICTLFLLTFFDVNLMGKDLTSFLVSCKLMKTFQKFFPVFVTLNSLTFARLFSLNFSSESPWCSPVPLKFESYNLHHCKKNCCKLVFLVFTEQKPLLQKSETKRVFKQKNF